MSAAAVRFSIRIEGTQNAPASARDEVGARCDGLLPGAAREELMLMLSEVVTNAVRHGPGQGHELVVSVELDPGWARIEVLDKGSGFEQTPGPPEKAEGGWGLFIVEELAERWGVSHDPRGTNVWFELRAREAVLDG